MPTRPRRETIRRKHVTLCTQNRGGRLRTQALLISLVSAIPAPPPAPRKYIHAGRPARRVELCVAHAARPWPRWSSSAPRRASPRCRAAAFGLRFELAGDVGARGPRRQAFHARAGRARARHAAPAARRRGDLAGARRVGGLAAAAHPHELAVLEGFPGQQMRKIMLHGATIVFVTPGYAGKRFIYERARDLGVRAVVFDEPGSWAEALVADRVIAKFVPICLNQDSDEVFAAALAAMRALEDDPTVGAPAGCCTFCELSVPLVARLCESARAAGPVGGRDRHGARQAPPPRGDEGGGAAVAEQLQDHGRARPRRPRSASPRCSSRSRARRRSASRRSARRARLSATCRRGARRDARHGRHVGRARQEVVVVVGRRRGRRRRVRAASRSCSRRTSTGPRSTSTSSCRRARRGTRSSSTTGRRPSRTSPRRGGCALGAARGRAGRAARARGRRAQGVRLRGRRLPLRAQAHEPRAAAHRDQRAHGRRPGAAHAPARARRRPRRRDALRGRGHPEPAVRREQRARRRAPAAGAPSTVAALAYNHVVAPSSGTVGDVGGALAAPPRATMSCTPSRSSRPARTSSARRTASRRGSATSWSPRRRRARRSTPCSRSRASSPSPWRDAHAARTDYTRTARPPSSSRATICLMMARRSVDGART